MKKLSNTYLAAHEVRNIFGIYYQQNGNMVEYQHRPFSWGNPPADRPELLYPKPAKEGVCPGQVYIIGGNSNGIVDPSEDCVLTFHQDACLSPKRAAALGDICDMTCGEYKSLYYPDLPKRRHGE